MTARRLFRSSPPSTLAVRATIVKRIDRADDSTSRQIVFTDEFVGLAVGGVNGANVVIPTPYNVGRLFELIDQSNMLRQCMDAYVTNTVGTGWEVAELIRGRKVSKNDRNELQSFIDHANSEESLSAAMKKVIWDREGVGFGFLEVIRDAGGFISLFRWAPSLYTRLCVKHPTEVLVEYDIPRGQRISVVKEFRLFRRYIQIVNGKQRWFKEYGDPRKMDFRTGAFEGESGYASGYEATELYHFKNMSNESYGVPRWINQLPSIIGSREAEEVNLNYFRNNTVPPMLLTVAGGRLTAQSYQQLTQALNENNIGQNRQHGIMLLEAIGEGDTMDGKGTPVQLKVDKLTDARQSDGLFDAYDKANQNKVRGSWRLPPVTVGQSQDVNFATANVSAFIAETQVFAPDRSAIDEVLNKQFVNGRRGMALRSAKLVSRTPSITSPELLVKTLTALNIIGAVTPRQAQKAANQMLQTELEPYPEKGADGYEDWMDKPIALSMKTAPAHDQHGNPQSDNTHAQSQVGTPNPNATDPGGFDNQPQNGAQ
jgi:PBSX family phage portal protein